MASGEPTVAIGPEAAAVCTKSLEAIFARSDPEEMCEALQAAIQLASSGQSIDHLVLPVIKHASASTDHRLKKLLHVFWPLVECYRGGQLKPHIMLISNSILRDLKSPNEMILCSALRCVLHLQVSEVVSSLIALSPLLLSRSNCRQPLVLCC
ncbi:Coatomer beta subunit [Giardia duodenalis]|uniref:Coatomer beta subunit n=1 Tax=Giardia intestinalis TaxID=5741 RepID=V6TWT2_GIAIN|nr:Coatomer beta subunit [Giardia intestinalis]